MFRDKYILAKKQKMEEVKSMIVTCDPKVRMSYIYLQQPKEINPVWMESCNIKSYLEGDKPEIPYIFGDKKIQDKLMHLSLREKTYLEDLDVEFEEEYLNDKENGYINGIELRLGKKELINLFKDKVFKLYETEYLGRKFLFLSLDYIENIFDENNVIYAANSNRDVYYIVAVEDKVCYIKAIISSRDDLYNLVYLKVPNFILY
ncbi:hypothetical protein [Candidatus Clostridium radicumherbarum]|uniref:Uncharacterized protein n=1 Tax=Candidatus Clostridium radicumherbarum TaxID=3381662 RepID=A0ABW8U2Q0_9CLOT